MFLVRFLVLFMKDFLLRIKSASVYTLASSFKVIFGAMILLLTFTQLNVKEDPELSIITLLIGVAVMSWGVAYFLFYGGQRLFMIDPVLEQLEKTAYKCSLIFSIYSLLNVLFIVSGWRNRRWGLVFLCFFVVIQVLIFTP